MIPLSIPELSDEELEIALDYSINKRKKDTMVSINNNYKKLTMDIALEPLMNYILDKKPIITPYGAMFSRHGTVANPLVEMIRSFLSRRAAYKKEMFKYPKGHEMYNRFNLLQSIAKVDVNSIYGAMAQAQSIFYNIYCAGSITAAGRGSISASIMFFESFMANNVRFASLDEIIVFIDNIRSETRTPNDHIFRQITLEECFTKIILTCGYKWLPTEREFTIVWDILSRCSQQDLNRIYYKNNLYEFCDNPYIQNLLVNILVTLKAPFLNPNEPPEEIKGMLDELLFYLKEYVYYGYMILDKLDRIEFMFREVTMVTDTDSCMVTFDPWFNYCNNLTAGIDMEIKHQQVEIYKRMKKDDEGNYDLVSVVEKLERQRDFDFITKDIIERDAMISPVYVLPQDGLRHSIINVLAYCVYMLMLDYMVDYSKHYNSYQDGKKCCLIMKNEFLFKSLMLTNGQKNYASFQEVQEGNPVPKSEALGISGLPLDKVTVSKSTSKELKRIIKDKILDISVVDQMEVLKELAILEKKIYDSLVKGETQYYKPLRVKGAGAYDQPMRNQGIKGAVAYNALKGDNDEAINLDTPNSLLIIKTSITPKTVEKIKDSNPETYLKMKKLMESEYFKKEIGSIAIPANLPVPEWISPFINYTEIIHNNLNNFPLESIGIHRFADKNVTYTNVLEL